MDKSIFGTWTLNGIDEKSREAIAGICWGSHLSPLEEGFCLTLEQASRAKDDVYVTYRSSKNECFRCFTIDELNIYQSSAGSVFGVIVQLDEGYEGCSLIYIGPHQGERILEQYKVMSDGNLSVSYLYTSPHKAHSQAALKFKRLGDALVPCPFRNIAAVNNWRLAKCHASGTLRDLHLEFSLPSHITAGTVIHFTITVCAIYMPLCVMFPRSLMASHRGQLLIDIATSTHCINSSFLSCTMSLHELRMELSLLYRYFPRFPLVQLVICRAERWKRDARAFAHM